LKNPTSSRFSQSSCDSRKLTARQSLILRYCHATTSSCPIALAIHKTDAAQTMPASAHSRVVSDPKEQAILTTRAKLAADRELVRGWRLTSRLLLLAAIFLGERLRGSQWAGAALIIGAAFVLASTSEELDSVGPVDAPLAPLPDGVVD